MERGYVKLWRKTLDSGIISNGPAWQLFGYLLMNACHSERKQVVRGTIFELKPGDVVFSRAMAAAKLDLGEQQIRTALNLLKKLEIVTSRSTNKITIISFAKWDTYNGNQPATNQQDNQQDNQHLTSNQPASDLHLEINKNEKIKKILNPPISPASGGHGGDDEDFSSLANEPSNHAPGSRADETNPRATGSDLRSAGANPRSLGTNPRAAKDQRNFAESVGDGTPIEFQELRELWDTEMRTEGPMAGWKEYKQAKAGHYWPGVSRIAQDVEERKAACVWNPGYEIGLARYLAEQTWLAPVKPRASPRQPATPTEYQKTRQEQRNMAIMLLERKAKKQEAQNGKNAVIDCNPGKYTGSQSRISGREPAGSLGDAG